MPSPLAEEFTATFRAEHREVRDTLLALIDAFRKDDRRAIGQLLEETVALTGPHFRYEEETLYPALVSIFGAEYIEKLLGDHDRAIGTARALAELAVSGQHDQAGVEQAVRYVRSVLPHVSDCDGLSIMTERLDDDELRRIFAARSHARQEGLDLFTWAAAVRGRESVAP